MNLNFASAALAIGLLLAPVAAQAASAVAILDVHNARCQLCPLIVERALKQAKGVKTVKVGEPDKKGDMVAEVVFDLASTNSATLVKLVTDQGYPSQVSKEMTTDDILMMKPISRQ